MNKIDSFKKYVRKLELGELIEKVSFKTLTSLKVGGICELLYKPTNLVLLGIALKYLKDNQVPFFVIGRGTNLLVNDRYFNMVLISLENFTNYYVINENESEIYIYVEAGVSASILAKYLISLNLTGGEFLSVIPGSVGGLTYMNAGAYKKSISELIYSITFFDDKGLLQTVLNKDNNFNFSYRFSAFCKTNRIITSVVLHMVKQNPEEKPQDKVKRYLAIKKQSQPLNTYNAGSTFKNHDNFLAWQIVDKLGYRGYKLGGAMVSIKHANFIINYNNATFIDIMTIIKIIEYDALTKLNIQLECEWEIIQ